MKSLFHTDKFWTPPRIAILKIYVTALVLGLGYALWLRLTGLGAECQVYAVTGLLCPGCGVTRMFFSLLRGDIPAAFGFNGAALCLFLYWNLTAALYFLGRPAFVRTPKFLYGSLWTTIAVLLTFGVLRNFI